MSEYLLTPTNRTAPLALRPRDAARVLGVSPRLLWDLSAPRGPIPCVRLGSGKRKTVVYSIAELQAWLKRHSEAAHGGQS